MKIVLIIAYLILTVAGVVLMKLGGNAGSLSVTDGTLNFGMSIISGIGFICYIISFLLFTRIVGLFNLSYIYPIITGIVQILTLIASAVILKENISWQLVLGASMIIIGIIVMNLSKTTTA